MTTFDKREEAFERKFALDEALKFKAEARSNRLLGLWAAEKLGLSGEAATAYAREAVASAFAEGGVTAVIRRLTGDFATKNIAITADDIHAQLSEFLAQAIAQVKEGM